MVVDPRAESVEQVARPHLESVRPRVERAGLEPLERQTLLFCIAFWSAAVAVAVHLFL